jgi:hypothetical protein
VSSKLVQKGLSVAHEREGGAHKDKIWPKRLTAFITAAASVTVENFVAIPCAYSQATASSHHQVSHHERNTIVPITHHMYYWKKNTLFIKHEQGNPIQHQQKHL